MTSATTTAEYKQVTVLFADVVGSMAVAARLGPERLRELMTKLVDRCAVIVRRYGGTPDKFTGDGVMAIFGAPAALEDHALRACLAALDIQRIDDLEVSLRVGLNSGHVIAGEIGSGPWGYTAIGEAVGLAQRMESVAPPGGVMLSESTARLVAHTAELAGMERVHIKGSEDPVPARRLLRITTPHQSPLAEPNLIGRQWELHTVAAMIDRALGGRGSVVGISGPPGIGKSRLVREAASIARRHDIEVFDVFCESHTAEVPFHAVTRLLRTVGGAAQVRTLVPDADDDDVLLLDDLLGAGDPDQPVPSIDPDARRRRLTAMINTASLARTQPALYILEDAHWIDQVSEAMIADFLAVIPQTPSLVLVTYRPEYRGALSRITGAQTISLAPLSDPEANEFVGQLLGDDQSVADVGRLVAERAAGNPFFSAEMVRELAERGVLDGPPGRYTCRTRVSHISMPPTLQATIAARIDRLPATAKRTLNAAAVIGSRFTTELFDDLNIDPAPDDLVSAELIDQVGFGEPAEYAFRHPLIRAVAYESQLRADRAEVHRRLAAALQRRHAGSEDEHSVLIAEHLEFAGDDRDAFGWHMRAGMWSTNRDIRAAHRSWQRARLIADALPAKDPDQLAMRIAPRTLLCATSFRAHVGPDSDGEFDELHELCDLAGDKTSLAIGMTGVLAQAMGRGDIQEATRLSFDHMALIESIDDPNLTVGLSVAPTAVLLQAGEFGELMRWSQLVLDLADGNPSMGDFILGSPLAVAFAARGTARWMLGAPGWRDDFEQANSIARATDRMSYALVVAYTRALAITSGVLLAGDDALREIEEAARIVEAWGDNVALAIGRYALGTTLMWRGPEERERALETLAQVREMCVSGQYYKSELPVIDGWRYWARAQAGDLDGAIPGLRESCEEFFRNGQLCYCVPSSSFLVEALLTRGTAADLVEAESVLARLVHAPLPDRWAFREVIVARVRALLAKARGDDARYRSLADQYHRMAVTYGYEGHQAMAAEMLAG